MNGSLQLFEYCGDNVRGLLGCRPLTDLSIKIDPPEFPHRRVLRCVECSRRKTQLRVCCTDSARENISREPCREELSTLVGEPQP